MVGLESANPENEVAGRALLFTHRGPRMQRVRAIVRSEMGITRPPRSNLPSRVTRHRKSPAPCLQGSRVRLAG